MRPRSPSQTLVYPSTRLQFFKPLEANSIGCTKFGIEVGEILHVKRQFLDGVWQRLGRLMIWSHLAPERKIEAVTSRVRLRLGINVDCNVAENRSNGMSEISDLKVPLV